MRAQPCIRCVLNIRCKCLNDLGMYARRRIGRILELKKRAIDFANSGVVASLIGVSNFLARLAYEAVIHPVG